MTTVTDIDLSEPPAHFRVGSLITAKLRNTLVFRAPVADVCIFDILQTASLAAWAADVAVESRHPKDVAEAVGVVW